MVVREAALMLAFLLQGAFAEKRALLRANARKSKEAMPLVTLPESLLLQGQSGDNVGKASSSQSDYASSLLNSIRESAAEIVGDARNAVFGTTTSIPSVIGMYGQLSAPVLSHELVHDCTAGTFTGNPQKSPVTIDQCAKFANDAGKTCFCYNAALSWCVPTTNCNYEDQAWVRNDGCKYKLFKQIEAKCESFTCPDGWTNQNIESTTYTQDNCCKDVAAYAAANQMSKDNAKSRLMLITIIEHAQVDLMNRLQEIGYDLEATDARAKYDLQAINATVAAAKSMPIMASNAESDVNSVQHNAQTLLDTIADIVNKTVNNSAVMDELDGLKNSTQRDASAAATLSSGQRRVQANSQTMHALVPRLMQLQRRIGRLESSLNDGNISRMVDDTANQEVMDLMEDVSRAFGRFIRNKRTL